MLKLGIVGRCAFDNTPRLSLKKDLVSLFVCLLGDALFTLGDEGENRVF